MTQQLQSLLDHAQNLRDQASVALAAAEERSRSQRLQQQLLLDYRRDYAARAPAHGGRAAAIELVRGHHGFMQRLDQAIAQQQVTMKQGDAQTQRCREQLLAQETRLASVRKLSERRTKELRGQLDRMDQRRSDEAATQRHWRDSAQSRSQIS